MVNQTQASLPYTLDQLIEAFETAHSEAEWERIAELNQYTRPCVEVAMDAARADAQAAGSDPDQAIAVLKPKLEKLSTIYQSMQRHCSAERDALAVKLGEISTGRVGVKQYSSTSRL